MDRYKELKDKNMDFFDKKSADWRILNMFIMYIKIHFGRHTQFKKLFFNCIKISRFNKVNKEINCKNITKLTFSFYRG